MRRLIPYTIGLASLAVLASLALSPGCGNECTRTEDCKVSNICYRNICTPVSASYVHCATNHDCGANGQFVCQATRCIFRDTVAPPSSDAGPMTDAVGGEGPFADAASDTGINPDAAGGMDALPAEVGPTDTGTTSMDASMTDTGTTSMDAAGSNLG